jgi:hypothetical protein
LSEQFFNFYKYKRPFFICNILNPAAAAAAAAAVAAAAACRP